MNDTKYSIDPTFKIDLSDKSKLEKSLKAKKIIGDVELNYIVNNQQNSPYGLEVLFKILIDRINVLENEVAKLKKDIYEVKNQSIKKEENNLSENPNDYLEKRVLIETCCVPKNDEKFLEFQEAIKLEGLNILWKDNFTVQINKSDFKMFNKIWDKISLHESFFMYSDTGPYKKLEHYFSFK